MAAGGGSAIELHGLSCDEIKIALRGIPDENQKIIADKISEHREYLGKTALYVAVEQNNEETLKCLLAEPLDADPGKRPDDSYTPLHNAVINDNLNIVRILKKAGANPARGRLFNGRVYIPLFTAAEYGFTDIIEFLLKDSRVVKQINMPIEDDYADLTPLIMSILEGHEDTVKLLKERGAILSDKHKAYTQDFFQLLLRDACYAKNLTQVKMLVDNFDYIKEQLESEVPRIDLNYVTAEHYSPLYIACSVRDNLAVIEHLHSKGAVFAKNEVKWLKDIYHGELPRGYGRYIPIETPSGTPLRASMYNSNTNAGGASGAGGAPEEATRPPPYTPRILPPRGLLQPWVASGVHRVMGDGTGRTGPMRPVPRVRAVTAAVAAQGASSTFRKSRRRKATRKNRKHTRKQRAARKH